MSDATFPLFNSGDPTLGDKVSEEFGEGKPEWEPIDPNADLEGKTVQIGGREWTIGKSINWSSQYVYLTAPAEVPEGEEPKGLIDMICRPAAVIRRHLQILEDDAA